MSVKAKSILTEEHMIERVRHYIREIGGTAAHRTPTAAVLEDALSSSGKMLRPRLLLECAAFGPDAYEQRERLYILAAMVELTHMASLIHDDIVDEAPFRRGKSSVQARWGKDAAVYAGDLLIARVYARGIREGLYDAVECLARTTEEMCAGEIGQAACRWREDVSIEKYYANICGKTAALFRTACGIGAAETGCPEEICKRLECFGEALGYLFQLRDDLLDFSGATREAGKETHKDFRDGIYTLPVLMALRVEQGRKMLLPLIRANRIRTLTHEEITRMERQVIACGGVESTWNEIKRFHAVCGEQLDFLEDYAPVQGLRRMWNQLGKR